MPRRGQTGGKKAPGTAVDPRNGQKIELQPGERPKTYFPAPVTLRNPDIREQWEEFWLDPVAQLITPADKGLLTRYFETLDRYYRLITEAEDEPWIRGSTGQRQANPFFSLAMTHEKAIQALEQQLGIGPKNRAALGIAVITERRSLEALNAEFEGDDPADDEDPRVTLAGEVEA